jgi:hypothetical protein
MVLVMLGFLHIGRLKRAGSLRPIASIHARVPLSLGILSCSRQAHGIVSVINFRKFVRWRPNANWMILRGSRHHAAMGDASSRSPS